MCVNMDNTKANHVSVRKQTSSKLDQTALDDHGVPSSQALTFQVLVQSVPVMSIFIWFINILIKLFSFLKNYSFLYIYLIYTFILVVAYLWMFLSDPLFWSFNMGKEGSKREAVKVGLGNTSV